MELPQLILVHMPGFPGCTAATIKESRMNLNPDVEGMLIWVSNPVSARWQITSWQNYLAVMNSLDESPAGPATLPRVQFLMDPTGGKSAPPTTPLYSHGSCTALSVHRRPRLWTLDLLFSPSFPCRCQFCSEPSSKVVLREYLLLAEDFYSGICQDCVVAKELGPLAGLLPPVTNFQFCSDWCQLSSVTGPLC